MRCPNRRCRRVTKRVVTTADRNGKIRNGCPACISGRDKRLRTGRKIWSAYEAYGIDKTIEKNHEWIESVQRRAAKMRRTAHHSNFTGG